MSIATVEFNMLHHPGDVHEPIKKSWNEAKIKMKQEIKRQNLLENKKGIEAG